MKTLIAFEHIDDSEYPAQLLEALRRRMLRDGVGVRLVTAADIPAGLAAEALGLSAEALETGTSASQTQAIRWGWSAEEIDSARDHGRYSHEERKRQKEFQEAEDALREAASRVREAKERRKP